MIGCVAVSRETVRGHGPRRLERLQSDWENEDSQEGEDS